MRRFFGKLANVIRQTNKARPAQGGRRRASLQVEALETRQLLSTSPVAAVIAAPLNVPPLTPIQFKYQSLGGASGFLGKAVTGELPTPTGGGKYEQFQHGNIYWSASTGAHDVYGPILNEYLLTASEQDAYGNSVQNGPGAADHRRGRPGDRPGRRGRSIPGRRHLLVGEHRRPRDLRRHLHRVPGHPEREGRPRQRGFHGDWGCPPVTR